ncbi:SERINE PALMITOYL TRANSFERASE SUBUNIT 2 [Encephalitozoon cuniculi GB-M1]|uniref:serine C-palmitoyltransferase n=2 Tax=Encephalitozoon cuniculi TaxID=6035 RepID=Q8SRX7_ENCCU|nr:serine C-palmitoyltransferase LCB2 [Encephalitozoon cuniculi GB-M1]AGE95378.1 serine palmitoyl transferase subunit 2 [Encephalitozoon cuniculi]KMV66129.1 serine palmitoyltransferase [Encephalitozoon cuniculi EcunIII-L]UYI27865.1 pyridoxal phosphate-dependent aspartate aminotransferase [Encephalitozoon cuniculi]CAD26592.1 SERINE PALMITOYL TRANSFERASE SUBUNIT 2 [Encephalitozoon cuniculi GB-M1]
MLENKIPLRVMLVTYLSYLIVVLLGHAKDTFGKIFFPKVYKKYKLDNGKPPLYSSFESFFSRRIFRRVRDCWERPIVGVPGRHVTVMERISDDYNESFRLTGRRLKLLNFGSYNYLGFSSNKGPVVEKVVKAVYRYPLVLAAPAREVGCYDIARELEEEMASFLHQEDCMVFSMGYGTNSSNIPVICEEETLILSDELNHASLITGAKISRGVIRVFEHNNMEDLERKLVFNISQGQPLTHRAWKKIIVIVEGIYSMEGTVVKLRRLVELKRKYKFYIFVDEAHSIGALGATGRGVCEHTGVDFTEVDILMGTFTKSFGGMGGYIAGSRKLITWLRFYSDMSLYGDQLPPLVCSQVLESLRCIKFTELGRMKIEKLRSNTVLMRQSLVSAGFFVLGDEFSPVIPVLILCPGKVAEFSRRCMSEGIGVVVVGYPATPILTSRARLCVSASHTTEDVMRAFEVIDRIGEELGMKICK